MGAAVQRAGRDSRIIVVIIVVVVVPVVAVVTSGSSSRQNLDMESWRAETTIEICNQRITDEKPSWINIKHSS